MLGVLEEPRARLAYRALILRDRPVGYWPMSESASPFVDLVSANNLAVTGTGLTYQSAQLLSAHGESNPKLTAATTYAEASSAAFQFAGRVAMSAEAWVKPTTVDATARRVWATYTSTGVTGWLVWFTSAASGWRFVRGEGVGLSTITDFDIVPSANTLYHIVVTYDGANYRFYVDGQLVAGPTANTRSVTATAGNPFRVGQPVVTDANNFLGWVGHVALYDYELTPAQVLRHYRAGHNGAG